jgi:hypothetical protein
VNWETIAFLLESGIFLLMGRYRQLMLHLLAAERARLLAARSAGTYTSRTLTRAQRSMDLMEATLQQIPDLTDQGG